MTVQLDSMTVPGVTTVTVLYIDGEPFTVGDWQGPQPQSLGEVTDFDWYRVDPDDPSNTDAWKPTIMVNGLPRVLE